MQVRMGVDNMVRMVKITATPSVVDELRKSYVIEDVRMAGIIELKKNRKG